MKYIQTIVILLFAMAIISFYNAYDSYSRTVAKTSSYKKPTMISDLPCAQKNNCTQQDLNNYVGGVTSQEYECQQDKWPIGFIGWVVMFIVTILPIRDVFLIEYKIMRKVIKQTDV